MAKISEKDLLDVLFELTHIKNEEGEDIPNFCFASDLSVDLDKTEEDIAITAIKNGYNVFKVFPGETMLGGLLIVADGATTEPVENMYKEFYGEVPEISEMTLNDDEQLVEVEPIEEYLDLVPFDSNLGIDDKYFFVNYNSSGSKSKVEINRSVKYILQHLDKKIWYLELFYSNSRLVKYQRTNGSLFWEGKRGEFKNCRTSDLSKYNGVFTFDEALKLFEEFPLINNEFLRLVAIEDDDDIVVLYRQYEDGLEIEEGLGEDLDLVAMTEITDEDRWGDTQSFEDKYKRQAEELGATIEFKTKVGPKRLDSFWYKGTDIAKIKYKDYVLTVFGLYDDAWVELEDGTEVPLEDFEEYGFYNDDTFPDYHDACFPAIEFSIATTDYSVYASSYSDLDYDSLWDLESALDLDWYINVVIPDFEERYKDALMLESSNKRPKISVRDPNAQAMWGRTRHRVELPKKGKGSFKRHSKHRFAESYLTPTPDDIKRFTDLLKENGWTIESVKEDESRYDEANNIHIQIIDNNTFPVSVPDGAGGVDIMNAHRDYVRQHPDVWDKADELGDLINEFDPDRKYHITYSASFGGTSHTGIDCTGKITAGIDMRPYFEEDVFTSANINEAKKKKKNPLKATAEKHRKTDKKGARGWFVNLNAGNVEKNIQFFNHANGVSGAESTITAPAGLGEDLDLVPMDKYVWDFDLASKFTVMNYKFDYDTDRYTDNRYYYARIPETALKVSRDDYKDNKLLKRKRNKKVLSGVENFFKEHPTAKWCIISCRDVSRSPEGRFVNAYRVLDEDLDLVPVTVDLTKDGYIRHSDFDRHNDFGDGELFVLDGHSADYFMEVLMDYLIREKKKFSRYDIRIANSFRHTADDELGCVEFERDDANVYVTVTPNIWLNAVADFVIPIDEFKEEFGDLMTIDTIPTIGEYSTSIDIDKEKDYNISEGVNSMTDKKENNKKEKKILTEAQEVDSFVAEMMKEYADVMAELGK